MNILKHIGDEDEGGTPVPMPNTAVKPLDAEDTRAWAPGKYGVANFLYSSLAQSVERTAVNRDVVGSSPTRGANLSQVFPGFFAVYLFFYIILSLCILSLDFNFYLW